MPVLTELLVIQILDRECMVGSGWLSITTPPCVINNGARTCLIRFASDCIFFSDCQNAMQDIESVASKDQIYFTYFNLLL